MDFNKDMFNIIWSEGALYLCVFKNCLERCNELLKQKGYYVVTEAV